MSDFRERAFLPIVLPVAVVAAFGLFAFMLSRVFLAAPELIATLLAISIAGYILFIAALIVARPRISSRSLGVGVAIAMVGVVAAGTLAAAAGMRDPHEADHAEPEHPVDVPPAEIPADAAVFVADGLAFIEAPATVPAGTVTIALDNRSGLPHNVVFEGIAGDSPIVDTPQAGIDVGQVELPAGEHTYYCSIPGHRAAGMEGTLTAE